MPGDHWAAAPMTDHSDGVMAAAKRSNGESGVFSGQESNVSEPDADNLSSIYNLLEQKERDLLLAAELGKALLEKNEELSQQNEKMAEDFSQKLEVRPFFLIGYVVDYMVLYLLIFLKRKFIFGHSSHKKTTVFNSKKK